jgi:hypothetical protein
VGWEFRLALVDRRRVRSDIEDRGWRLLICAARN